MSRISEPVAWIGRFPVDAEWSDGTRGEAWLKLTAVARSAYRAKAVFRSVLGLKSLPRGSRVFQGQ